MDSELNERMKALRARRRAILDEWLEKRRQDAEAGGVVLRSGRAWMDHVPQILDQLFEVLDPSDLSSKGALGIPHADHRFEQGFDLPEVVLDLGLLEELLLDHAKNVFASGETDPRVREACYDTNAEIVRYLNECIVQSTYAYMRRQKEEQRERESRLLRRIQTLGDELTESLSLVGESSHDLRGSTDVLIRLAEHEIRENPSSPKALLQAMVRGLSYNRSILEDLSVLGTDLPSQDTEMIRVNELIRPIVQRTARSFGATDGRIIWEVEQPLTIRGERLSLERLVANLTDNAFRHGDESPVRIGVFAAESDGLWYFEIENGLAEGSEPIAGANGEWKDCSDYPGRGIGLSVVSRVLESFGGALHFSAHPENRLRFRATFPYEPASLPESFRAATPPPSPGFTVLVSEARAGKGELDSMARR